MKRGSTFKRRSSRRVLSVAERQMQLLATRPFTLPEGSDPELGELFGIGGGEG